MLAAGSLQALRMMEENTEMFDDIHEKCLLMHVGVQSFISKSNFIKHLYGI